jgi:hypothetical protein
MMGGKSFDIRVTTICRLQDSNRIENLEAVLASARPRIQDHLVGSEGGGRGARGAPFLRGARIGAITCTLGRGRRFHPINPKELERLNQTYTLRSYLGVKVDSLANGEP